MHWIKLSLKDPDTPGQFLRARSGLKAKVFSAPGRGLIFLHFDEVCFATRCARLKAGDNALGQINNH